MNTIPKVLSTAGDTLGSLFESEESNLLRLAYGITGRRVVAEEIVQDVFLRLHGCWGQVAQPRAWLYRVVRNEALDAFNRCQRERVVDTADDSAPVFVSCGDESPEARLVRMETVAELRSLIEHLSPDDRQLIRLKYFDSLKYREISQQTGLTVTNVGYRLHHILKSLAAGLMPSQEKPQP